MKNLLIILGSLVLLGVVGVVAVMLWLTPASVRVTTENTATTTVETNAPVTNTTTALSSTTTLDDLGEPHLAPAVASAMIADIGTSAKYVTSSGFSLVSDCGSSANADILKQLDAVRKVQVVNVVYPIVRTPNLQRWNTAQANTFMADPTVVCGVGSFFPFEVQADHILWRMACSSGLMPGKEDGPAYLEFVQCIQAQEVVSKQYGLTD